MRYFVLVLFTGLVGNSWAMAQQEGFPSFRLTMW